ncbi:MAG: Holliday junction resolvase Hjc [Candidatus Pacearchaeota archaeon]
MPKNKSKGSKAERELLKMFLDENFRAVRVAGSGVMEKADCDLLVGKIGKKYAIEVKSSSSSLKYISKIQIENFLIFSEIFDLTPVIAIRFNREGWFFLSPNELKIAGKNFVIGLEELKKNGKRFSQFFN